MSLSRRSFFKTTAGAIAVAAIPDWVKAAPKPTDGVKDPLGVRAGSLEGHEYIRVRLRDDVDVGTFCAIDSKYMAKRLDAVDRGRIGIATARAKAGDGAWLMVHGRMDQVMVSYPYTVGDYVHGMDIAT